MLYFHFLVFYLQKTSYGSALHAAANGGSAKCLQYLLDAGAYPNVTDWVRKPVL